MGLLAHSPVPAIRQRVNAGFGFSGGLKLVLHEASLRFPGQGRRFVYAGITKRQ
jgi:hypothetical protein